MIHLQRVRRRTTGVIKELVNMTCEQMSKKFDIWKLEISALLG